MRRAPEIRVLSHDGACVVDVFSLAYVLAYHFLFIFSRDFMMKILRRFRLSTEKHILSTHSPDDSAYCGKYAPLFAIAHLSLIMACGKLPNSIY